MALRDSQATPILLQVRSDVTRFRYGDEQHLDEALTRIFRVNKPGGIRRAQTPVLARLREETVGGKYALVLGFTSQLPFAEWEARAWPVWPSSIDRLPWLTLAPSLAVASPPVPVLQTRAAKFDSFFGPGVACGLTQTEDGVDVALVSDGSAAGGIRTDEEVLPPLMPGLAPRVRRRGRRPELAAGAAVASTGR